MWSANQILPAITVFHGRDGGTTIAGSSVRFRSDQGPTLTHVYEECEDFTVGPGGAVELKIGLVTFYRYLDSDGGLRKHGRRVLGD